jgi:RHS repeat-associated protein
MNGTLNSLSASTGSLVNPFPHAGRESDTETGLYYYRARYYDPTAGRFLSEDPTRFIGGINFDSYVGNTPIGFIDPFGLSQQDVENIVQASSAYLQLMNALRARRPGRGRWNGNLNNIFSFLKPRWKELPYLGCGQQADVLQDDLFGWSKAKQLDDTWTFDVEEGFLNWKAAHDPFWHNWVRAESTNRNDPDIILDPWRGEYQYVPRGGSPNPDKWNPF